MRTFLIALTLLSATAAQARTQLADKCPNIVIKNSAYSQSRALYQLGLVHPAFAGFDSILASPKETALAKQSAAECVRVIELNHAHLKLSPAAVTGLLLSPAHTPARRTLLTLLARGQLAPADYPKELLTRVDDAAAVKLIAAMKFAQKNPNATALPLLLPALASSKNLPERVLFDGILDLANLTTARLLYMGDRNVEALEKTKQILKKYPSLPEAFELKSWIEVGLNKSNESVQDAITLRTPSLKNYFSPQTTLVPAIVFLEHCDYLTAKPHLSYFRVKYKNENDYLSQTNHDYYQDFVLALKQKKPSLSSKIVANWIGSAGLLSVLDENNLLIDEKAITTRLHYTKLQAYLEQIEVKNVLAIKNQFSHLAYGLRSDLNDAVQNAALVQVDVLLGVSKEMAQTEGRAPSNQKDSTATTVVSQPAKWSWEKKDTSKMENDEIWADEIGNLDVEINNKCK